MSLGFCIQCQILLFDGSDFCSKECKDKFIDFNTQIHKKVEEIHK